MPVVIWNDDWLAVNGRLFESKKRLPALAAGVAEMIGQIENHIDSK
jgi:hypothetical protein